MGYGSDVWSLGAVVFQMMTGKMFQTRTNPGGVPTVNQSTFQNAINPHNVFDTFGRDLVSNRYSKRLIALIHKCLAFNALKRPTPELILREANRMLPIFQRLPRTQVKVQIHTGIPFAPAYQSPQLDTYTQQEIAGPSFGPLVNRSVPELGPFQAPFWVVPAEAAVPALPPFAPGIAQVPNQATWPWQDTMNRPPLTATKFTGQ
jgi:serine/threonine protein kinase